MNDLSIGVIGYGLRGGLARHAHRPGEGSRVVAVFDPDVDAHRRFRADFGDDVHAGDDLAAFLGLGLDAVFVLSPDYLHEEHALALLDAGVAVYLEKPMAITTEGCDRVLRAAQKAGGRLYLGHNMRHMPFVREMKRLIDAGAIGEPKAAWCRHFVGHGGDFYFADWHAERRYGTSLLLQKGAHDIDVLHWLCGSYTETVTGMGERMVYDADQAGDAEPWWRQQNNLTRWPPRSLTGLNPAMDVEDVSMLMMRLQNGMLASYQQCHFTPDYWRNYTIIGTEGRIENFGNGEPGTVIRLWNSRHDYDADGDSAFPIGPETGEHGGADPRIVAEFLRYVRDGGATETSPVAARYAVAAGCAGADSLRAGSVPVRVPEADTEVTAYFGE
ncbi:Gfo/Idh/MocA family protein [Actinopolymorpha alba]|uniref:Gfo/Idh/MocA family protein n=1 Tax=Actinopolymorpha alba TaxID=533267 RepID=UPI0003746D4E|nr:Gfo/Idh/MocA family oxidoreductase [Actinopolymorpha alba]